MAEEDKAEVSDCIDAPSTSTAQGEAKFKYYLIEERKRFSDSILWQLVRNYYTLHGSSCWEDGHVPSHITSNSFIAHSYAKVILGYMSDLQHQQQHIASSEPFYVIELGAGHGKFGFLTVRALLEETKVLRTRSSGIKFRYIMTDLVQANIDFWKKHPAFEPLIAQGVVDFAIFDAEKQNSLSLQISGQVIALDSNRGLSKPGIVIANYLLDSLTCDHFRINDAILEEGLITVVLPRDKVTDDLAAEVHALCAEDQKSDQELSTADVGQQSDNCTSYGEFKTLGERSRDLLLSSVEPKEFLHWFDYRPVDSRSADEIDLCEPPVTKVDDEEQEEDEFDESTRSYYSDAELDPALHGYLRRELSSSATKREEYLVQFGSNRGEKKPTPRDKTDSKICHEKEITQEDIVVQGKLDDSEKDMRAVPLEENDDVPSTKAVDDEAEDSPTFLDDDVEDDAACVSRGDMSILFPLGPIKLIQTLRKLWPNGLMFMSADKGYLDKSGALGLKEPHLAMHGCISTMVNYHALKFFSEFSGGFMLAPTLHDSSIKVTGLVFPPTTNESLTQLKGLEASMKSMTMKDGLDFGSCKGVLGGWDMQAPSIINTYNVDTDDADLGFRGVFAELPRAFDEAINSFGPYDFFSLQLCINDELTAPSAELALRLLRLSKFDADVFHRFSESFMSDEVMRDPLLRSDVAAAIHTTWKNYFSLEKDHDVPFQVARFFFMAEEYSRALQFFQLSIQDKGDSSSAFFDMGLCQFYLRNYKDAVQCFDRASALDPNLEVKCEEWKERVQTKLLAANNA